MEGGLELLADRRHVPEDVEDARVALAEGHLDQPVLVRLEAARRPEGVAELGVLGRGEGLQDAPLVQELRLDVLDPGEDLERALEVVVADELDRRPQLVEHELEPELRRLVLDDEQHLVVVGRIAERPLGGEEVVEPEVRGVVEVLAPGVAAVVWHRRRG